MHAYYDGRLLTQSLFLSLQNLHAIVVCKDNFGQGILFWVPHVPSVLPNEVLENLVLARNHIAKLLHLLIFRVYFFEQMRNLGRKVCNSNLSALGHIARVRKVLTIMTKLV